MTRYLFFFLLQLLPVFLYSQVTSLKGNISDEATGEALVGATVLIQGTFTGTISDLEGNFELKNVETGRYNLVISYVSYDNQIITVDAREGEPSFLEIKLKSATISVEEVTIVGQRKTDTESAIVANIKLLDVIANGISADQIKKSQDSDAAEVIRRVPGITITDGRFVIVRGLSERYSHVMLNGAPAPSFETDKKSFSFDAIPSGMIQNIMIFKSPAPEFPADFAGAVIDIMTKEVADKNEFKISYSVGHVQNTSFKDEFLSYQGGKYDFLGFDDGTRSFPKELPSTQKMKELYVWPNMDTYYRRMDSLQTISRAFNNNWNTIEIKPFLDQSFSAVLQRRFLLGKVSMGNITALNYKFSSNFNEIQRKEYYEYDYDNDKAVVAYDYKDMTYKQEANLGFIHNWLLIFGNNQRIGFRNLLNNIGETTTTRRTGEDGYNTVERLNTNLRYQQRFIYSGQLDGSHIVNNNLTRIKWLAGYSYVFNNDPDNRRYSYVRPLGSHDTIPFDFVIDAGTSVYYGGRITQVLKENNRTLKTDLVQDIYYPYSNSPIQIKAGVYYDNKERDFDTRLLGVVAPRGTGASRLQVGDRTRPVEELLTKENFYYDPNTPTVTGFMYRDGTSLNNSYLAYDRILAGYAGLKIPIKDLIEVYGGARLESFNRKITGFYDTNLLGDTADITIDTVNIFPSLNVKVKLGQKYNLRFSYGKTVNRPEFRENSPIIYEDFDQIAIIMGNPDLKPAYILNYDARIEWYPNLGEIISLAAFYKDFTNPIEMFQIPAGTGWNYMPFNTEKGVSKGLEFDMRKSLLFTEGIPVLGLLKNMTLVFNTAFIKSEINTDKAFARDSVRIMQGQSPFIINLGLFYNQPEKGMMVSVNYNRIGERIAFAGTPNHPHVWELPRNSMDITLDKKIGDHLEFKLGIKDLLNSPVNYRGYFGLEDDVPLVRRFYSPNRKINLGFSWTF